MPFALRKSRGRIDRLIGAKRTQDSKSSIDEEYASLRFDTGQFVTTKGEHARPPHLIFFKRWFVFAQSAYDLTYSNLSQIRLAATASSAVRMGFAPVTLTNWGGTCTMHLAD